MNATWAKLQDGSWGARVEGAAPAVGTELTMRRRDGTVSTRYVARVVWAGQGIALCEATTDKPRAARRPTPTRVATPDPLSGLDFLNPGSPAWNAAWAALAADPINAGLEKPTEAYNPEFMEAWQYMGSVGNMAEFRHRCHPVTGQREYRRVTV